MAVKTKSNRRKLKGRTRRAKHLLGRNGDVRKSAKVSGLIPQSMPEMSKPAEKSNPVAGHMMMPVRLMSQLPLQVWRAQTMLAYQGLMMMQAMAFGRPIGSLPMP